MDETKLKKEVELFVRNCTDGNYSLKEFRIQMEDKYGVDLADQKDTIRNLMHQTVNDMNGEPAPVVKVETKKHDKPKAEEPSTKKRKIENPKSNSKFRTDEQGEVYFELPKNKRINLQNFKGKWYVSIREYYDAGNGVMKPGKKGISLPLNEWEELKACIPEVDELIERKV